MIFDISENRIENVLSANCLFDIDLWINNADELGFEFRPHLLEKQNKKVFRITDSHGIHVYYVYDTKTEINNDIRIETHIHKLYIGRFVVRFKHEKMYNNDNKFVCTGEYSHSLELYNGARGGEFTLDKLSIDDLSCILLSEYHLLVHLAYNNKTYTNALVGESNQLLTVVLDNTVE